MCECNSQSYTFLFSVQFANTVFWESAMGYLWTQWTLRWQRKYPQKKARKKLCFKLLRDVWIHLTELQLYYIQQSIITIFEEPESTSLDRIEAYADKGNIISSKRERSFLRKFFVIWEFILQSYNLVSWSSLITRFSWNLQSDIWDPIGSHGEKGNIIR